MSCALTTGARLRCDLVGCAPNQIATFVVYRRSVSARARTVAAVSARAAVATVAIATAARATAAAARGRTGFAGALDALAGAFAFFAFGERQELATREARFAFAIDA